MKKINVDLLLEALAVTPSGIDTHDKIQRLIVIDLSKYLNYGFIQDFKNKLTTAFDKTSLFIDKNNISADTQYKWIALADNFLKVINNVLFKGIAYAASNIPNNPNNPNNPKNTNMLRQKAIAESMASNTVRITLETLKELSNEGIDITDYTELLDVGIPQIISGIFSSSPKSLLKLANIIDLPEQTKAKFQEIIQKKITANAKQAQQKTEPIPNVPVFGFGNAPIPDVKTTKLNVKPQQSHVQDLAQNLKKTEIPPEKRNQIAAAYRDYIENNLQQHGTGFLDIINQINSDYLRKS
jgi:hypothetical protein